MKFATSRSFPAKFFSAPTTTITNVTNPSYSLSGRHHIPHLTYICYYLVVTRALLVSEVPRNPLPGTWVNKPSMKMRQAP
jgi:hypothetical protein